MRLLRTDCEELKLDTYNDERKLPKYAILSHVWLAAEEEIKFDDRNEDPALLMHRKGWAKLDFARKQALKDGYLYVWADTFCIDKNSSAELAEAINSMYRWYGLAEVCYVYLEDMSEPEKTQIAETNGSQSHSKGIDVLGMDVEETAIPESEEPSISLATDALLPNSAADASNAQGLQEIDTLVPDLQSIERERNDVELYSDLDWESFANCKWFTRGWTLQEMIAPAQLNFYSSSWSSIGTLPQLASRGSQITGVHLEALQKRWPIESYSIAQRMSWASRRQTTKVEDEAYCLLGIFDLNLPIIYGEGVRAFARLQEEILRVYTDQTIFAWICLRSDVEAPPESILSRQHMDLIAKSPSDFQPCSRVVPTETDDLDLDHGYNLTDKGVRFTLPSILENSEDFYKMSPWTSKKKAVSADFYPECMHAALRCCYQDDPSYVFVVDLTKQKGSLNSYFVTGGSAPPIRQWIWLTRQALWSPPAINRTFTLLRSAQQETAHLARQTCVDTIICRVTQEKGCWETEDRYMWKIAQAEPAELWNHASESFLLPESTGEVSDNRAFVGRLIVCQTIDSTLASSFAVQIIGSRDKSGWDYRVTVEAEPGTKLLTFKHDAFSSAAIMPRGYFKWAWLHPIPSVARIVTRVQLIKAVHQLNCMDIDVSFRRCTAFRFLFCTIASFAMLPLAIILPITVLSKVRQDAYISAGMHYALALTRGEAVAVYIGVPISCLLSAWLLYESKIYFLWRPRSWQLPMLWLLRMVSGILSFQTDQDLAVGRLSDSAGLANVGRAVPIISTCGLLLTVVQLFRTALLFGFNLGDLLLAHFPRCRFERPLIFLGYVGSAISNLGTLIPILAWLSNHRSVAVPWAYQDCEAGNVPESAAASFAEKASQYHVTGDLSSPERSCDATGSMYSIYWVIV